MSEADWHVVVDGQTQGPYTFEELASWVGTRLGSEHLVWNPRLPAWTPVSQVPELAARLASAQPPVPQTPMPQPQAASPSTAPDLSVPVTRVTISGLDFVSPKSCCCCGRPADHSVVISATNSTYLVLARINRTRSLSMPSCGACTPQMEWANQLGLWGLIGPGIGCFLLSLVLSCVISVPAVLVLVALGVSSQTSEALGLPYLLYGGAVVVLMLGWWRSAIRKRPKRTLGPNHVCDLGAVYIKRFDKQSLTLNFFSEQYALELARLNPGRVVVESSTVKKEGELFRFGLSNGQRQDGA